MANEEAPTDAGGIARTTPFDASLEASYDDYPQIEEAFQQVLDGSLNPRGPDSLFDVVGTLELPADGVAIDVGCGDGHDAVELARRSGLRLHGIDPVQRNIELASALAAAEGLSNTVEFQLGSAEALPVPDETADLVWCKEVLMFTDLYRAFGEFRRVLRPNGVGLVYQVLTGPRMSDEEARRFWEVDLGYGPAHSMRPSDVEAAIAAAGLELRRRIDFASEWGEYAQERTGAGGRRLVHAARLLRNPQRYVEHFGEAAYRIMLGDCLWHVYRMIGKLHGAAFIFTKPK
jgi:SAM-dependent methyltransferase